MLKVTNPVPVRYTVYIFGVATFFVSLSLSLIYTPMAFFTALTGSEPVNVVGAFRCSAL
jgi:hypothetical protein